MSTTERSKQLNHFRHSFSIFFACLLTICHQSSVTVKYKLNVVLKEQRSTIIAIVG